MVLDLQKELLNNVYPLSQLMTKAWVVAQKLKLDNDIEKFYKEINGYSNWETIPNYREIKGKLQRKSVRDWEDVKDKDGSGRAGWGPVVLNYPASILKPIRILEKEANLIPEQELYTLVDSSMARIRYTPSLYSNENYRVIYNSDQVADILHHIKLHLISWTMLLTENGILGNDMSFEKEEKKMAQQVINAHTVMMQDHPVNSSQTAVFNTNQLEIFEKLLETASQIDQNGRLISSINDMKNAAIKQDKISLKEKYCNFMEVAANHMTLFAPFLPQLVGLF